MDLALDRGPTTSRSSFDRAVDGHAASSHNTLLWPHACEPGLPATPSCLRDGEQLMARRAAWIAISWATLAC